MEEEEILAKDITNIFNKITAEHLMNLDKERVVHVEKDFGTPNRQD
jgi:cell division GTPase FtsZ